MFDLFYISLDSFPSNSYYNVSRHTDRRYECIASNGYPPDVGRSFQLTVQYAPELTLFINEEIVSNILFINSNHNEIRLKCQVIMNPSDKVYWMKDNKKINHNYQIYKIENYQITELILKYFTNDYQGEYTCVASNFLGSNSKSIQLLSLPPTITTSATERITSRRKRPKHHRTTTEFYSTESLRMMTVSSKSVKNTYQILIMFILLFTMI